MAGVEGVLDEKNRVGRGDDAGFAELLHTKVWAWSSGGGLADLALGFEVEYVQKERPCQEDDGVAVEEIDVENGNALAWRGIRSLTPMEYGWQCSRPGFTDVCDLLSETGANFPLLIHLSQDEANDRAAAHGGFEGARSGFVVIGY